MQVAAGGEMECSCDCIK